MGHGIIFVGGSSNLRENTVYKGSKDNWGMYKYHPSRVKINEEKTNTQDQTNKRKSKKKKSKQKTRKYKKTNEKLKKSNKGARRRRKKIKSENFYAEIRKNANELHSISVRKKLSHQLYSNYQLESEEIIFNVLNAYFECCTDIEFAKKGQISVVKQNIDKYLAKTNLSKQHSFVLAENDKKLKSSGVINSENVINSLHRIFLLNQSVPKKLMELATNKKVGFSQIELIQLAELYQIVLTNSEKESVDQICEKHNYVLLSKSAQALRKRISEFVIKEHKAPRTLNQGKDLNMTKEKAPKKIKKGAGKKKKGKKKKTKVKKH